MRELLHYPIRLYHQNSRGGTKMLYIHQTLLSSSSVEGGSEDETRLYIDPNAYIWQLECCVVAY